jgi:glycosyltransferase involved in cell wall biosynthesis
MNEPLRLRVPAPSRSIAASDPPRVSVLVPAFNAAETVPAALDSVLGQQPPPLEVIVCDDGSTDGTEEALRPYADTVRVVRHQRNLGLAAARNSAAGVARGQLLGLCDADDVWLPGRVRAFEEAAASRPDVSIWTTDAVESRSGTRIPGTYYGIRAFPAQRQDLAILRSNFVFGAGALRADAFTTVGGYRPGLRFAEDWDLFIRLLLSGHLAGLIDLPLYEYRRSEGSLTGREVDLAIGVLEVLNEARALAIAPEQLRQLQQTEQEWREAGARAAFRTADKRMRGLALRAATGRAASPKNRVKYGVAALLPPRLLAERKGAR